MTDWQDATNLLFKQSKKRKKSKKNKDNELKVGQRCWECGLYIDNLGSSHYCMSCLFKQLKKMGILSQSGKGQKGCNESNYEDNENKSR
jgi:hypothetical protein